MSKDDISQPDAKKRREFMSAILADLRALERMLREGRELRDGGILADVAPTVLDLLGRAAAEGYLDLDEYEGRVAAVTVSRTVSDLYAAVGDLPPQFRWDPAQAMPKSRQERDRESAGSMALMSLILGAVSIPTSLCIGTGGLLGLLAVVLARKGMLDDESRQKAVIGMVLGFGCSVVLVLGGLHTADGSHSGSITLNG